MGIHIVDLQCPDYLRLIDGEVSLIGTESFFIFKREYYCPIIKNYWIGIFPSGLIYIFTKEDES